MSVFVPIPCCLDDDSFVVEAKVWDCDASHLVFFFFNITLAIQGLLWFHTNFRIACSSFEKNAGAILIGIALNVSIALGSIDILSIFVLPIHEHGMFFHFFPFSFSLFNFFHRRSVVFSFNFVNVYF